MRCRHGRATKRYQESELSNPKKVLDKHSPMWLLYPLNRSRWQTCVEAVVALLCEFPLSKRNHPAAAWSFI